MYRCMRRRGGVARCSFKRARISLVVALALPASGLAQQVLAQADLPLKEVVVTATRQEREAEHVPATITTVGRQALDRRMPHDEAALFADEPDVAMARDLSRYGSTSVNIRGIDGVRVLQQVDGVRLPDYYYGGGPSNITAAIPDGVDMDFLKRVEILRGPASSLYGSDALGGVVGYLTLDPKDLLQGKSTAGRWKATWREADDSLQNTVYGAWQNDLVEGLLALSRREGHELKNQGSVGGTGYGRETPNPLDARADGILAKLILKPAPGHRIGLTFEGREQDNTVQTQRLSSSLPKVTATGGKEETERQRIAFNWDWKPSGLWFDTLSLRAWRQDSDAHTRTQQTRSNTSATCSGTSGSGNTCLVDMDFRFKQKTDGASLQLSSKIAGTNVAQMLTYGADWAQTRVDELRDYWIYNRTAGTVSKTLAGDTYPLRDFAPGEHSSLGLFLQDEILLADGRLQLTPGIRYDNVKLEPDAMTKAAGSLVLRPVSQDHAAVSPKFGLLWQVTPEAAVYGQIVRGFRAPNYNEVNGLFYNAAQNYVSLPNADLKPERSTGVEVGTRLQALGGNVSVALFDNRYENFIEQTQICTSSVGACPGGTRSAYQNINLSKVRISGLELRGQWRPAASLVLNAALARAVGRDQDREQPINSVEPTRISLSLLYDRETWGGEARLRAASAVSAVSTTTVNYFRPAGYAVVDLGAWWKVSRDVRLNVGLNNLLDQTYTLWSDVRQVGLSMTDPGKAFYTQPGRNLSLALQVDF